MSRVCEFGMVKSDIFALWLGCAEEGGEELLCAIHMVKLVESLGLEGFLEEVFWLFQHPAAQWYVSMEGDLEKLSTSLFDGKLKNVRFVRSFLRQRILQPASSEGKRPASTRWSSTNRVCKIIRNWHFLFFKLKKNNDF